MRLSDVVSHVAIDPRKLTDYALDPEHPIGCHKARVFEPLGFTRHNYKSLLEQIESAALAAEAHLGWSDARGAHYSVDLEITGPAGQQAIIRTGWLVRPNSDEARLTTLYVRKKGRKVEGGSGTV
jgi:hypothetical protein